MSERISRDDVAAVAKLARLRLSDAELDRATSQLGDKALTQLRLRTIGFIFQSFQLLPRASALENVELPLVYRRVGASERRRRALRALHDVGLQGRERHTDRKSVV